MPEFKSPSANQLIPISPWSLIGTLRVFCYQQPLSYVCLRYRARRPKAASALDYMTSSSLGTPMTSFRYLQPFYWVIHEKLIRLLWMLAELMAHLTVGRRFPIGYLDYLLTFFSYLAPFTSDMILVVEWTFNHSAGHLMAPHLTSAVNNLIIVRRSHA